ncbi:hypothetical protein ACIA8G_35430 [Lentzea sp. NPDC051213]|uniref:hypothetical protein n=1 Tax=Lentzea sp. NPDC051213 TaxID=3364126 RepID=UPI0037AD9DB3
MAGSPIIATVAVRVPLEESVAKAKVEELFPNSEAALKRSLFYKQMTKFEPLHSKFFVSAYHDKSNFTVITNFQYEEVVDSQTLSRFDIQVEPGIGVDTKGAVEEIWRRLLHAKHLIHNGERPQFCGAAITSGGSEIITGRRPSLSGLVTDSSELRLPVLVGAMSMATLTMGLVLGIVPAAQIPAAWWVVGQLVVPAVAAVVVAVASNRGKGISWRIE